MTHVQDLAVTAPTTAPPALAMLQMIGGLWVSRSLSVVARLGIADQLKDGPRSIATLASATGTNEDALYRVLRALASVGVFEELPGMYFATTPLASTLETAPASLRYFAMGAADGEHLTAWGNLLQAVRTGEIAFDNHFGMSIWDYYAEDQERSQIFGKAMTGTTESIEPSLLQAYDYTQFRSMVDVGGGEGSLLSAILRVSPHTTGIVYDAPDVAARASQRILEGPLESRLRAVGGDFFESVPAGADGYIMKWILHDWDDDRSQLILSNIRRAIPESGKLLVFDSVIQPGNAPDYNKFMDVNMLVMTGGRERTEQEFRTLLASAGFQLTRVIPTGAIVSIVEAVPV